MVSFICDACGNTVKKNQVEKHYLNQCRNCSVLSCIDCGVDFPGDTYTVHTSCISEAEKYQGHLYQAKDKENKGEVKQKKWLKQVQSTTVKDPKLKSLLERVAEYSNVPRKQTKFQNFCKNSLRIHDRKMLDKLWQAFSGEAEQDTLVNGHTHPETKTPPADNVLPVDTTIKDYDTKSRKRKKDIKNIEVVKKKKFTTSKETADINGKQGKFHWHKTIKHVLKETEECELSVKKLRKKVVSAYQEHGVDHRATNVEEFRALFDRKLRSYPKVKIIKEKVRFV